MRLPTFYEQNLIPNWGIYCVFVCQLVYAFKFVDIKKHRPQTFYMRSVSYRVAFGI